MAEKRGLLTPETAEIVAVEALAWLAEQPEALGRFLAVTGIGPAMLRSAASEPGFLRGVLDYFASDDALLIACANGAGIPAERIATARRVLNGHD